MTSAIDSSVVAKVHMLLTHAYTQKEIQALGSPKRIHTQGTCIYERVCGFVQMISSAAAVQAGIKQIMCVKEVERGIHMCVRKCIHAHRSFVRRVPEEENACQ